MSQPAGFCPNCGAPISFRFSAAVQTTCEFCKSILVRVGMDLRKVGEIADLPPDMSLVQIGTEGVYGGKAFTIVGRILYEYEHGGWNEWHMGFSDGTSGWLSDAQAEYAVTYAAVPEAALPSTTELQVGLEVTQGGRKYTVATLTDARYVAVEGELPFEYWDKAQVPFVDLKGQGGTFATIDYSEEPALLFVGESVKFKDLKLINLREPKGSKAGAVGSLSCPNCGAGVELRAQGQTTTAVCPQCMSLLDARSNELSVLEKAKKKMERVEPAIPLGSKGTMEGVEWQAIGFQTRFLMADGERYEWREYVLFHQTEGFRYLTEYNGHWNFSKPIKEYLQPHKRRLYGQPSMDWQGEPYALFQTAMAETAFVMGEFPWKLQRGEKTKVQDYIAPPGMVSSELYQNEVTWSYSAYIPGAEVWTAFGLPGKAPAAVGVFANQPSPYPPAGGMVRIAMMLLVFLVATWTMSRMFQANQEAFRKDYRYVTGSAGESSFVTPAFELKGRPSAVDIHVRTDVENAWIYFNMALINETTGQAWDWGREISYYHGKDSDGSWSEGGESDVTTLSSVPPGRYYLRVEPEWQADPASPSPAPAGKTVHYSVSVMRDVTLIWPYFLALPGLFVPMIFAAVRRKSFEGRRWAESDPIGAAGNSSGDDDDDEE